MNSVAPLIFKPIKPNTHPWINNNNIRALRQICRRAERKWKKDKLQISHELLKVALANYQKASREARHKYFSIVIAKSQHKPAVLFATINNVLNPPNQIHTEISADLCEKFLDNFVTKITNLSGTTSPPACTFIEPHICRATWSEFEPISLFSLYEIIDRLKPSASPHDTIPPHFFKQIVKTLGPSLLSLINKCLSTGTITDQLKHATVRPQLKKVNLDPAILSNFRPISNLPFIAKILEKVISIQLYDFLSTNSILYTFQSGFRVQHSTETALLKVLNNIYLSVDSVVLLLDLSAAFDTINHSILISRLERCIGLQGNVLKWFTAYLTNRSFSSRLKKGSLNALEVLTACLQDLTKVDVLKFFAS